MFKEGVPEKANTKPRNALKNLAQPQKLLAQGLYHTPQEGPRGAPPCVPARPSRLHGPAKHTKMLARVPATRKNRTGGHYLRDAHRGVGEMQAALR